MCLKLVKGNHNGQQLLVHLTTDALGAQEERRQSGRDSGTTHCASEEDSILAKTIQLPQKTPPSQTLFSHKADAFLS